MLSKSVHQKSSAKWVLLQTGGDIPMGSKSVGSNQQRLNKSKVPWGTQGHCISQPLSICWSWKSPRNLQLDPRSNGPRKNRLNHEVSNSSIATYWTGSVGKVPNNFWWMSVSFLLLNFLVGYFCSKDSSVMHLYSPRGSHGTGISTYYIHHKHQTHVYYI